MQLYYLAISPSDSHSTRLSSPLFLHANFVIPHASSNSEDKNTQVMRRMQQIASLQQVMLLLFIHVHVLPNILPICHAFSSPVLGIGALFKPKGMKVFPSGGDDSKLTEAGQFFTEAFWAGKSGGAAELTKFQAASLERQQVNEFRRRYGKFVGPKDRRAELIVCQNGAGELMGCAGIEVDSVQKSDGRGQSVRAPLMSNLAVGRKFRRKGLAEDLVEAAEMLARKEWGYNEVFLYVEKKNTPAVRLYKKMGYRKYWEDDTAKTLIPTEGGQLKTAPTVIVCMKKRLGGLSRWLPF